MTGRPEQPSASVQERLALLEREVRRLTDIEEIRELKARYWEACDGNITVGPSHEVEDIAALYTEDGSWQSGGIETPDGTTEVRGGVGRDGIRAYFASLREKYDFIMHFGMAPIITVDGDRATGYWHYIATSHHGGAAYWSGGTYHDEYVRTAEGWKIKSTVVTGGFRTPYEEGWHKVKYAGLAARSQS